MKYPHLERLIRVNMQVVFYVAVLAFGLNMQSFFAWRRRRRVSPHVGQSQETFKRRKRDVIPVPSDGKFCMIHGEYALKQGKIIPSDKKGAVVDGMRCNKDRCWKNKYCWHCKLKNGKHEYERVSASRINDVICKDIQCLVGNKDTGLEYYSSNDSRSLPLANGPFSCNNYLCMSDNKCWKCRLNDEEVDFRTVSKGKEFDNNVTCCPIPKQLFEIKNAKGGFHRATIARRGNSDILKDDEDALENKRSIMVQFSDQKLITGMEIWHEKHSKLQLFTVAYSSNGKTWTNYQEFQQKAIFSSSQFATSKRHTLFKPLMARYLKVHSLFEIKNVKLSVALYGCDVKTF